MRRGISVLRKISSKIFLFFLIAYILFLFSKAVWANYQITWQIRKTEAEINQLKQKTKELEDLILYYQTESFKELEARRQLGLKKPDENVVILPTPSPQPEKKVFPKLSLPQSNSPPNYLKWWKFFFSP